MQSNSVDTTCQSLRRHPDMKLLRGPFDDRGSAAEDLKVPAVYWVFFPTSTTADLTRNDMGNRNLQDRLSFAV